MSFEKPQSLAFISSNMIITVITEKLTQFRRLPTIVRPSFACWNPLREFLDQLPRRGVVWWWYCIINDRDNLATIILLRDGDGCTWSSSAVGKCRAGRLATLASAAVARRPLSWAQVSCFPHIVETVSGGCVSGALSLLRIAVEWLLWQFMFSPKLVYLAVNFYLKYKFFCVLFENRAECRYHSGSNYHLGLLFNYILHSHF